MKPMISQPERLFPLFWIKGEDEETLRRGVREVRASGCGALCAESRTHPDFLGETWWRDIAILIDECQKLDMKLWIFDDQHFPSGYAAGKATGTSACRMMLTEKHMDVLGPVKGGAFVVQDDEKKLRPGEGVVAVVAARRLEETNIIESFEDIGGYYLGERIDLTDTVQDGMAYWDVPEGLWRVFVISKAYVAERQPPRYFANPLIPEGGQLMIDTVYEPHYRHFKEHFGKTLMGFFSDEPALRAGRGYHAVLGEYPRIPIPWRRGMEDILTSQLGENSRALLPGLWYEIGEDSKRIRYALMDAASRLYGENYSAPIGRWCRAHGVEYIGHVIEQNNTHARLGSGAGHFWRAISGQDMAGIDIVLHEVRPELFGGTHAWQSQNFEADDDFFRYMLSQMAVSCAHIDPKKKGRTMCEIFGAYGWQEDGAEMRYLANLIMSRGVNYFSPHAFTLEAFPDPDSPPHFDAKNPLLPAISHIFRYMARVAPMIDGGRHITKTAVLYYAEAEWANGTRTTMKTQAVVKALNQRQLECEIVPIDELENASFDLILIPYAESWPRKLFDRVQALRERGKTVYFIDALPSALSEGEGDISLLTKDIPVLPLECAADTVQKEAYPGYLCRNTSPFIHVYPYEKESGKCWLIFNEDVKLSRECTLVFPEENPVLIDAEHEKAFALEKNAEGEAVLTIEPGQMLIVYAGNEEFEAQPLPKALYKGARLAPEWKISLKEMGRDAFVPYETTNALFNITSPDRLPRFSGTVRYEAEIELPEGCAGIDLGECSGTSEVWIGEASLGMRVAPPYTFRFEKPVSGKTALRIENTNAAVFAHRDALSFFACLKPTGVLGPVCTMEERV